ncbi:MAG: glycine cleavage system protein GcvH [bacterium]|nr:MAG: glycine cleavage system protein GcvH [bacterium]
MDVPKNCLYTRDHLWVRPEGSRAVVGVTDYYQEELGEVVLLDLPEIDSDISVSASFGIIESDRMVSDLTAPLTGEVVEVNLDVIDSPELVNEDPYGDGWLVRIEMDDSDQTEILMSPEEYEDYISGLVVQEE